MSPATIALAFLERYPTPTAARGLGEKRLGAFLIKHGYSGRRPAAELLARLRDAPLASRRGPESEARRDAVLGYVRVIRALNASIKALTRSVVAHLGEHPDNEIFTSLPRSGQVNAAQMLAEWGDCRPAYDSPEAVAALAGLTPVTKKSGKHHAVHFRWACNKRFHIRDDHLRRQLPPRQPLGRRRLPSAPSTEAATIPTPSEYSPRAWTRVIYACWLNSTPYDAAQHKAACSLKKKRPARKCAA